MRQHTERELRVWLAWLEMDMDRPSRTDWHLMRLTAEVQALRGVKDVRFPDGQWLNFGKKGVDGATNPYASMSQEEIAAMIKHDQSLWLAVAGGTGRNESLANGGV